MKDLKRLFEGIGWWQKWEIEPGVFTPGHNDVDYILKMLDFPKDISGKRVLDIGAWNGCFSFECERRGAAEVTAIGPESITDIGFLKLKEYLNSKVQYRHASVYYLKPDEIGEFDIVLCLGVFYHLRYPLLGLDNIRIVCDDSLFVETLHMENSVYNPAQKKFLRLAELNKDLTEIPLLQFYRRNEICDDDSNWFGPNNVAMIEMLKSAGFSVEHYSLDEFRAYYKCSVEEGLPEFLNIKSGEGVYYDILVKGLFGMKEMFRKKRRRI